jgi:hypothetical protein
MAEMNGDTISDGTQIIDVINNKYLIFQKFSWYWISQNLNSSRVDKMMISSYISIIFDWRNNLMNNSKFIRIYSE